MQVAALEPLVGARTQLGWALVRRLLSEAPQVNVLLSPHSLAGALAVVQAAGVREAPGIARLLGSDDPSAHAAVTAALADPDPEGVELRTAQSIWTDLRIGFAAADQVRASFPEVDWRSRDFSAPETVAEMNAWASEQTAGMIDRIVERLQANEVLAALDAILFAGTWAFPFDQALTAPAPFAAPAGPIEVPLMEIREALQYAEGERWQAVRLPYGAGRLGLVVVLGPPGEPVAQTALRLEWDTVLAALATGARPGIVRLPRLRMDVTADLLDHLKALGLDAGDGPALEESLQLTRVLQRAVLEIDEQGTRAAAVTFIGAEITSVPPPPFELTADRPFSCAIHDADTGSLLFVGVVQHPQPITT